MFSDRENFEILLTVIFLKAVLGDKGGGGRFDWVVTFLVRGRGFCFGFGLSFGLALHLVLVCASVVGSTVVSSSSSSEGNLSSSSKALSTRVFPHSFVLNSILTYLKNRASK